MVGVESGAVITVLIAVGVESAMMPTVATIEESASISQKLTAWLR